MQDPLRIGAGRETLRCAALALLAVLALARPVLAQRHALPIPAPDPEPPPTEEPAAEEAPVPPNRSYTLFPASDVYPVYVADPHRTGSGAMVGFLTHVGIADSSDVRADLKAGGRFGVVRFGPKGPGRRTIQLSLDAGLDAEFDSYNKLDNIGWDGNYGLTATTADAGPWSFKLGILHCSGHVGDEYMERTGRSRIDYSREEFAFGTAYRWGRGFRAYGEVGLAYHQLTEEQEPWRTQAGIEWEGQPRLLGGRFSWYAAIDLQATQERGWRLDRGIQGGVKTKGHGRTWRIGIGYYKGRPPMAEFFQDTEARFTLGLWVDP